MNNFNSKKENQSEDIFSEIRQHLFIIMCEEHYTPLGVIRSLGEEGIRPHVIIIKSKNKVASASKYIDKLHKVDTLEDGYKILLAQYKGVKPKPFVIPCDDHFTSFLDLRLDEIKNDFYVPNARGEAGRITCFMEKLNLNNMAQKHGFNVAKTWIVNNGEIPDDIEYPIITKPLNSNSNEWKEAYHICNNDTELKEAYKLIRLNKLFLQQFIKKKNELCLDGVSVNAGKEWTCIATKYTYVLPRGYSAEYVCSNFYDEPYFEQLKESVDTMIADIGHDGVFEIELLIDENDKLWFLEINFRSSPWMYPASKNGINFFLLWAYGLLYGSLPESPLVDIPEGYKGMSELQDFKWRVLPKMISFKEWAKEVKSCNCLAFYNKQDKKPFFAALFSKTLINLKR